MKDLLQDGWQPFCVVGCGRGLLFVINGRKFLPQRDIVLSWESSDPCFRSLWDVLGKWYLVPSIHLKDGYVVKNMLSNRYEWLQLVLGSGVGDGIYRVREATVDDEHRVGFTLVDYDLLLGRVGNRKFLNWIEKQGLASDKEIGQYVSTDDWSVRKHIALEHMVLR